MKYEERYLPLDETSEARAVHADPRFEAETVSEADLAVINRIAPAPLRADQVYARSMYLCSDRYCEADHCRLSLRALEEIAAKAPGQSVLAGHDRRSLPLARFYKAEVVQRGGIHYVRAWFYWLRETAGARDLLLNIDGGVYREVSLAWRCGEWTCSVCGKQNGWCEHIPGQVYDGTVCSREIDSVREVLEGSLVFKGADKGTLLAGARSADGGAMPVALIAARRGDPVIEWLAERGLLVDAPLAVGPVCAAAWIRPGAGSGARDMLRGCVMNGGLLITEDAAPGDSIFGTSYIERRHNGEWDPAGTGAAGGDA